MIAAMRPAGVLLAVFLLSCSSPARPGVAEPATGQAGAEVAPPVEPPAVESPAPEPPPPPPCDRLRAEHQAVLEQVGQGAKESLAEFFWCQATPSGGQWAIVLSDLQPEPNPDAIEPDSPTHDVVGDWSIVHLSADGSRASVRPAMPSLDPSARVAAEGEQNYINSSGNLRWIERTDSRPDQDEPDAPEVPGLHDLDGDGEPELFVIATLGRSEDASVAEGRLWTFRDGRVQPYPPTRDIAVEELRDLDRDGRLDLATHGPYRVVVADTVSDFSVLVTGPMLWARALEDGSYSLSDPVALAATRRSCPERPGVVDSPTDAACARLWGVPEQKVLAELKRRCRKKRWDEDPCGNIEAARAFASAAPPVSLATH